MILLSAERDLILFHAAIVALLITVVSQLSMPNWFALRERLPTNHTAAAAHCEPQAVHICPL